MVGDVIRPTTPTRKALLFAADNCFAKSAPEITAEFWNMPSGDNSISVIWVVALKMQNKVAFVAECFTAIPCHWGVTAFPALRLMMLTIFVFLPV